ncbi:hypothetical protein G7Y89_g11889 [Cudoniella acicularis]|uniref:Uncharacterized protein n=1 Tax=Cudoniella acicularis TaxID=354080 RepID=A0A8H4RCX0_9HELO|nr:hypothetical protein G7Y89_g11889 [Cudoniella acicularis]
MDAPPGDRDREREETQALVDRLRTGHPWIQNLIVISFLLPIIRAVGILLWHVSPELIVSIHFVLALIIISVIIAEEFLVPFPVRLLRIVVQGEQNAPYFNVVFEFLASSLLTLLAKALGTFIVAFEALGDMLLFAFGLCLVKDYEYFKRVTRERAKERVRERLAPLPREPAAWWIFITGGPRLWRIWAKSIFGTDPLSPRIRFPPPPPPPPPPLRNPRADGDGDHLPTPRFAPPPGVWPAGQREGDEDNDDSEEGDPGPPRE